VVSGVVRKRAGEKSQAAMEHRQAGPGQHTAGRRRFKPDLKHNPNQTASNFGWLEKYFSGLRKIEMKYGWKVFEMRNNFDYRNFLRFWTDFELKFR
jgi:hypothetical protein